MSGLEGQIIVRGERNCSVHETCPRRWIEVYYWFNELQNNRLAGVFVIARREKREFSKRSAATSKTGSIPSAGRDAAAADAEEDFEVVRNTSSPGGPVKHTEGELKNFKIRKKSPTPGGPVENTAEEVENFRVINNLPPPEDPNASQIDLSIIKESCSIWRLTDIMNQFVCC